MRRGWPVITGSIGRYATLQSLLSFRGGIMRYKSHWAYQRSILLFVSISASCLFVLAMSSAARINSGPDPQQDVLRLDNRITQLEQRLYGIENNIRNLEQQIRVTGVNSGTIGPEDLGLLRSQIQLLQRRLADDECALAKLDERTLSPATRATRRSSRATDECRINVDAPLILPDRR